MGAGRYHQTTQYKRKQRQAKKDADMALGMLALPLLPVILPIKVASDMKKATEKAKKQQAAKKAKKR